MSFNADVNGQVLYVPNLTINKATHNTLCTSIRSCSPSPSLHQHLLSPLPLSPLSSFPSPSLTLFSLPYTLFSLSLSLSPLSLSLAHPFLSHLSLSPLSLLPLRSPLSSSLSPFSLFPPLPSFPPPLPLPLSPSLSRLSSLIPLRSPLTFVSLSLPPLLSLKKSFGHPTIAMAVHREYGHSMPINRVLRCGA